MSRIPVISYDWEAKLKEEPVVAKLASQGKMIRFSFFDLIDTATDYFTKKKLPFAYSFCIRNSPEGSVYREGSNQDKLKLALTDDQFYKDGFSKQPGKKKANYHYDDQKFKKEILKDTVEIKALNGKIEVGTVELLLGMIENHSTSFGLPLLYLICIGNSAKGTEYCGKCLYNGLRFTLTENRFRTYTLNMCGMEPVNTLQHYTEAINLPVDDDFDDEYEEEYYEDEE